MADEQNRIARLAIGAAWNSAGWAAGLTVGMARRLLGAIGGAERRADAELRTGSDRDGAARPETLRERGAELLRRSADVHYDESLHPAYERILSQLAPDEARILRLLAERGPQPSVDVRSGWLPFNIGSQLVAPGLTMIGDEAGCRYPERVHPYLNNLFRLGLVWFSRERVEDPLRYQVLEAQPMVTDALKNATRARTVRRSIQLTPFGVDFCRATLPLDTAELDALAGDQS
jgi:Abortive infection alpha